MKLLFSEAKADYVHYVFPYAIWAFPERGETPADLFQQGFLPSSRNLDRFYLCRQVRVILRGYQTSSENRRILRKGQGITAQLIPRAEFDYTPERREFYKPATLPGKDVMSYERLDLLLEAKSPRTCWLHYGPALRSVLNLHSNPNPGLLLLRLLRPNYYQPISDVHDDFGGGVLFAERGFQLVYPSYFPNALQDQFAGAEFFNGIRWSANLTNPSI
jgi:hypothetical protein